MNAAELLLWVIAAAWAGFAIYGNIRLGQAQIAAKDAVWRALVVRGKLIAVMREIDRLS